MRAHEWVEKFIAKNNYLFRFIENVYSSKYDLHKLFHMKIMVLISLNYLEIISKNVIYKKIINNTMNNLLLMVKRNKEN